MENMHKYMHFFPKCVQSRLLSQSFISKHLKRTRLRCYLDIPVFVEIVDAGYAAAVPVGVVNMADVPGAVAWVTGDHSLQTRETKKQLVSLKQPEKGML